MMNAYQGGRSSRHPLVAIPPRGLARDARGSTTIEAGPSATVVTPGRMTSEGATLNTLRMRRDRPGVAAYLADGDLTSEMAALLRRWAEPGRPALLIILDWETPFADVYDEDELL